MDVKRPARLYRNNRTRSADNHVIGHFRKKSLSIPIPSSEKPLAEIIRLKENRP